MKPSGRDPPAIDDSGTVLSVLFCKPFWSARQMSTKKNEYSWAQIFVRLHTQILAIYLVYPYKNNVMNLYAWKMEMH